MGYGIVDVLLVGGLSYVGINQAEWSPVSAVLGAILVDEVYHILTNQRDVLLDTFLPNAVSGSGCGCSGGRK